MNTDIPANIKALKFNGYKIELSVNRNNKPVAKLYKWLTVGKNKDTYKLINGYYFTDENRRKEWINKQMTTIKERIEYANKVKDERKGLVGNHTFKVGDALYQSWGYDQTNIDFYEVVGVLPKSVKCRAISQIIVPGSYGNMCENVMPAIGEYTGKVETKIIKAYGNKEKGINYYVSNGRHSLSLYNYGEMGVYQSHYA